MNLQKDSNEIEIQKISVNQLTLSKSNVRKNKSADTDETSLEDLANSIRENGLLNPISVNLIDGKYEVIAGQRRFLAVRDFIQEMNMIECKVYKLSEEDAKNISLIENVQRNDMTSFDKFTAYNDMFKIYHDINKICQLTGVSKPTIRKYINISNISEDVIELINTKESNVSIELLNKVSKIMDDQNLKFSQKEEIYDLLKNKNITTDLKYRTISESKDYSNLFDLSKDIQAIDLEIKSINIKKLEKDICDYLSDNNINRDIIIGVKKIFENL